MSKNQESFFKSPTSKTSTLKKSSLIKSTEKATDKFGHLDKAGRQRTTVKSRGFRPVSTKSSMHVILKSKNAVGDWSFLKGQRRQQIKQLVIAVAEQFNVRLLSGANVGNHIHLHVRFYKRRQYIQFIRTLTARIAFLVTGANKFNPLRDSKGKKLYFWTQRPITRSVHGLRDALRLEDYIAINRLEGHGLGRSLAEYFVKGRRHLDGS
jgi:REP element-mobilizing transposase RayT